MKLNQLAAKPQLIRVEINDEETIKQFGESLEFWIWDRQPMDKFKLPADERFLHGVG